MEMDNQDIEKIIDINKLDSIECLREVASSIMEQAYSDIMLLMHKYDSSNSLCLLGKKDKYMNEDWLDIFYTALDAVIFLEGDYAKTISPVDPDLITCKCVKDFDAKIRASDGEVEFIADVTKVYNSLINMPKLNKYYQKRLDLLDEFLYSKFLNNAIGKTVIYHILQTRW